jgi:hypothetical protein
MPNSPPTKPAPATTAEQFPRPEAPAHKKYQTNPFSPPTRTKYNYLHTSGTNPISPATATNQPTAWVHTISRKNSPRTQEVYLFSVTYVFSPNPTEPNEPKLAAPPPSNPAAHFARFSHPFDPPLHPLNK